MSVAEIRTGLGAQAFLFVAIGLALWTVSGRQFFDFLAFSIEDVGLGIALGIGLITIAALFFHRLPSVSEKLVRLQARNFAFLEKRLSMPTIVFMSLCAGVGEEALFRGGLQTLLSDYTPIPLAIFVASFAFMLIHFAKPLIALIILLIGSFFGLAYWWTGSLLAVMLGHAIYDVYAFWHLQREMHRLDVFVREEADTGAQLPER